MEAYSKYNDFFYLEEEEYEDEEEELYSVTEYRNVVKLPIHKVGNVSYPREKFLEVIDVGQGDSIIMRVPVQNDSLHLSEYDTYVVDTGDGKVDITKHIEPEDGEVSIILTHSHSDHIGGIKHFVGKMNLVQRLILPFCYNEIATMAKCITELKGFSSATGCDDLRNDLQTIVDNHAYIRNILNENGNHRIVFVKERMMLGKRNNIECLNPPLWLDNSDWTDEVTDKELERMLQEEFSAKFANDIKPLLEYYRNSNSDSNDSHKYSYRDLEGLLRRKLDHDPENFINEYWIFEDGREDQPTLSEIQSRANFLRGFLIRNITIMHEFNNNSSSEKLAEIIKNFTDEVHNTCIILRAEYDNQHFLLTGDASKIAFNRLIRKGKDISSYCLKMPHHGSKKNISSEILDAINPKVAIISHGNRKFGDAPDSHPNTETLLQLLTRKVRILLTEDVKKPNIDYFMPKTTCRNKYIKMD